MSLGWLAEVLLIFGVLCVSLVAHEFAHARVALALGDDTALRAGRVSLNPRGHLHPWGSLALPAATLLSGLGVLGFARPVPVSPGRLHDPDGHPVLVAVAGAAVNLGLALGAAVGLAAVAPVSAAPGGVLGWWSSPDVGVQLLLALGQVNVLLAVFNLLPVPPLDGSVLLARLLPSQWRAWWPGPRWFGPLVLLVLALPVPGLLVRVLTAALTAWSLLWL